MHRQANTIPEVGVSLALGFRDGIRPRLALMSVLAGFAAFAVWLIIFVVWRTELWSLADAVTKWGLSGLFSQVWPDVVNGAPEASTGAANAGSFWERAGTRIASTMGMVANFLLIVGGFLLLVMLSMRLYLELFLMSRVQKQCLPHYPSLSRGGKAGFGIDALSTLKQLAILCAGILLLVIPVIGGILFFLLASYLNVRSLVNDALEDLATVEERRVIVKTMRMPMLLLGVAVAGLLLIPLAGLFIPAILGASVCHLCMRALIRLRSPAPVA